MGNDVHRGGGLALLVVDDVMDAEARGFALPTGTVTFLLTDVEGSTGRWEAAPDAMALAVPRHYAILEQAILSHGGVLPVEQGEGDSVVGAFSRASDAVQAACDAQLALAIENWPSGAEVAVRMAVHTGEAQLRNAGNYFGQAVIRCARIRATGHGGQVLLSDSTATLAADLLPDQASLVDLGVHRLKDLGTRERIWQLVHPGLVREFAPLRSLDAFRHNLPAQLTPLIGRVPEAAEIAELIGHRRLVTLTGSGGVGKTRLALAVAADAVDLHPAGVWFVELAGAADAGSIGRAVLAALDLPEAPGVSPVDQIAGELAAGRSLLVLDNCEHVVAECGHLVAELLSSCPETTILATSREPLGVVGEVTWRVPSLAAPPLERADGGPPLSQYDSVRLFVERARRARPSFTVTDANAPAVAQICHRLDGIPLAIELAAARCRQMSADRISAELDDRFRLLTGGARTLMARQQTLAASVEWSFDLLDDLERRVLRRLGVFAGSFSLEAAEAIVAAVGDLDPAEVFDALCRLVDKSLVLADDDDDASPYRLLETLRAFALGRARDAAELIELRDAHARWWTEWIESHSLTGPTDVAIALVDGSRDNLRAALDWAATRDVELGLRLLRPFARALQGTGRYGDAMAAGDRLLAPDNAVLHPARWMAAAVSAAIPVLYARGPSAFVELLALVEQTATAQDDQYHLALSRWLLEMNATTSATLRDRARERREPYAEALATVELAIDLAETDPRLAGPALAESERIAEAYGSQYIRDFALIAASTAAIARGDLVRAVGASTQLLHSRTRAMVRNGLVCLATSGLLAGDGEALALADETADRIERIPSGMPGIAGRMRHLLELVRGGPSSPPADLFERTAPMSLWLGAREAIDAAAAPDALRAVREQATDSPFGLAIRHAVEAAVGRDAGGWHRALELAVGHDLPLVAVDALEGLGVDAADSESWAEALRLLGAAERLRNETGYHWRFAGERAALDAAAAEAVAALGEAADVASEEGRGLDWHEAAAFASRARGQRRRPRHGWASLTPTEAQVVELVVEGLTNPQIAKRLLVGSATVKSHLEHIFTKTGLHSRSQLAADAVRRGSTSGGSPAG